MNARLLGYVALIVIGVISAGLNLWLYLLERETRPLLFAGVGILCVIAGVVSIRRLRRG